MPLSIELKPETEARLRELARARGYDPERYARLLVEDALMDERLKTAGVRVGSRERALALLECWMEEDTSDEDPEEWAQILRNIEDGGLELQRVDV